MSSSEDVETAKEDQVFIPGQEQASEAGRPQEPPSTRRATNAAVACVLSRIVRISTAGVSMQVSGMWNPNFCAADGSVYAISVFEDIRRQMDHFERVFLGGSAEGVAAQVPGDKSREAPK